MATIASHTAIGQIVPDFSSQFLGDLQGLLEKAGRFTGATSAAIAFVDGDELVTKVSMGDCAPEPGSRSSIVGSFTGLCVQEREVQRCDDASKDSRVDSNACEVLGIASMVIVPILEKKHVYGVLAAFSPKSNAFSPTHVALLRTIADIVIELRKRYPSEPSLAPSVSAEPESPKQAEAPKTVEAPKAQSVPETKAPISSVLPSFAAAPAASESKPAPGLNATDKLNATVASIPVPTESDEPEPVRFASSVPEPVKFASSVPEPVKFASSVPEPAKTKAFEASQPVPVPEKKPLGPVLVKPESKPQPRLDTTVDLWKREPLLLKNETEPGEYARLITEEPPKKSDEILTTAADIGPVTVEATEPSSKPVPYSFSAMGALDQQRKAESTTRKIMFIAAALVVAIVFGGWFLKQRTSAAEAVQAVQAAAPQPHPAATTTTPAAVTPATSAPVSEAVPSLPSASIPVAVVVKKTGLNLPDAKTAVPEDKPSSRAMVVSNNSFPKHRVEDVEAPKVASADTSSVGNLLSMVKTAQPEAAFRSSQIQAPQLLKSVSPIFPPFARQMHIQSDRVVLNGTVEKDGTVSNIKVVRGKQVFVQPAISAVRMWKYKPAYLNGEPTSSTVEIVVNFTDHN